MERQRLDLAELPGAQRAPFPSAIAPMQATLTTSPFNSPDWIFEPKLDGVRSIALVRHGTAKLISRRGLDSTPQYPSVARGLANQPEHEMILDGEIVALDDRGRPSFQLLQQRMNLAAREEVARAEKANPVIYYVFDLLYLNGYLLIGLPLSDRKSLLAHVITPSDQIRELDYFAADGQAAFQAALEHGIEGIVAKLRSSRYEPGKRSKCWLKIKTTVSEDFVIGGFTQGSGHRTGTFGSLLIGYYDRPGRLVYAGHVGTGFDEASLKSLRKQFDALRSANCPFVNPPRQGPPAVWLRPELVAEVKFAEVTRDGNLRAPVFQRLRPDKAPAEAQAPVVLRQPQTAGSSSDDVTISAGDVADVLDQLREAGKQAIIRVQGHELPVNNLDKPFWPANNGRAVTKRDLLMYLCEMSAHVLSHLRDRPLTLVRYPHGVGGPSFYQKHWPDRLPTYVQTVRLYSEQVGADQDYVLCQNLPTLLWLAQLADLELHCSLARVKPGNDATIHSTTFTGSKENVEASLLNYPDFIAFDLDPFIYSGREEAGSHPTLGRPGFAKCSQVALWLKEILDALHLPSFVKTSGATGLHVFVPIARRLDYQGVRAIAENIAQHLLSEHPRDVTVEWAVDKRTGKIFVDYKQNARSKSLAVAYSPRAVAEATVSMPLAWDELLSVFPTDFTILTAPERIKQAGDIWAGILQAKVDISSLLG